MNSSLVARLPAAAVFPAAVFPIFRLATLRRYAPPMGLLAAATLLSVTLLSSAAAAAEASTEAPRAAAALPPSGTMADRVVAVVNKGVITAQELENRLAAVTRNLARQGGGGLHQNSALPLPEVLRPQILEHMITEQILLDYARDSGLRVDETQLDAAMTQVAAQNKASVPAFQAQLKNQGVRLEDFREDLRRNLIFQRLREREIDSRVFVGEREAEQVAEATGNNGQEYHLAHLLVAVPENADSTQLLARQRRAQAAEQALQGGRNFAQVAASYSDTSDALNGGDLGWRAAGRIPPFFLPPITQLRAGQITPILRSPAGFHIFKLMAKRDQNAREVVEQTRARHILIKTSILLSDEEARARLLEIRQRIVQSGASFEEEAKQFSEDPSANQGGNLGWLSSGETVPEFEQAMAALKPNELSPPVRSPFGWHLLQVLERRRQDITETRKLQRIRQELQQRKVEEQYDEWVRVQRAAAFVQNRLEER